MNFEADCAIAAGPASLVGGHFKKHLTVVGECKMRPRVGVDSDVYDFPFYGAQDKAQPRASRHPPYPVVQSCYSRPPFLENAEFRSG